MSKITVGRHLILLVTYVAVASMSRAVAQQRDTCTLGQPDKDAHVVDGEYANNNYGGSITLGAGVSGSNTARAYIHFNVDSCAIPPNATIDSATLYLYDSVHAGSGIFCIYAAQDDWAENGITWNNQPGYRPSISACAIVTGNGWWDFDATDIVRKWHEQEWDNDGFALLSNEGYAGFYSREVEWPEYRPVLYIEWSLCSLDVSSTNCGSVTNPGEGQFTYPCDPYQGVAIEATAEPGCHFAEWTGTAVDAGKVACTTCANTTVIVDSNYTLVANFEADTFAIGDMNCDDLVNAFDIDPFVLALTDPAGYAAAWPDCDRMLADCNGDGAVDAFDIDCFVELLTGG